MVFHVFDGILYHIAPAVLVDLAVLRNEAERSDEVPQAKGGVLQIFRTVTHLQILEYLFKQQQTVLEACLGRIVDAVYFVVDRLEEVALLSCKMKPVDAPRIAFGGGVGVGNAGLNDKKLAFVEFCTDAVDADPSPPLCTINQNVLFRPLVACAVVSVRLGIVTDI